MSKRTNWYAKTGEGLTKEMLAQCPQVASRPGWHGPCHRGHRRCVQAVKRREAYERSGR